MVSYGRYGHRNGHRLYSSCIQAVGAAWCLVSTGTAGLRAKRVGVTLCLCWYGWCRPLCCCPCGCANLHLAPYLQFPFWLHTHNSKHLWRNAVLGATWLVSLHVRAGSGAKHEVLTNQYRFSSASAILQVHVGWTCSFAPAAAASATVLG